MQTKQSIRIHVLSWILLSVCLLLCLTCPCFAAKTRPSKQPALTGVVDLPRAVAYALKYNPDLEAAQAEARASKQGQRAAMGAFGPKLGMSYQAYKQVRKSEPTPTRLPEQGTYALAVEISQPVFQGFRLLADYQKAALQAESDKAKARQTRLSKIEEVQTSFIAYLRSAANVTSQQEAMERLADQLRITHAFYATGLKPKLDILQAEVDLREAEDALLRIEQQRDTEQAKLNTMLGLSVLAKVKYVGNLKPVPFRNSLESCLELAYRNRPDMRMAILACDIAGKDRLSVQSGYYPKIEAYYNVTGAGNTWDLSMQGEHGSRYTSWEVGAKATWDVFQWGTTYFADQRAGELVNKVRAEARSVQLNIGYDIKAKMLRLREAEKRIAVAKSSVASATEAYEAAQARYREQVGTGYDVLNTQAKLTQANFH